MSESSTFAARPVLRESEPLTDLLSRVPRRIQKGMLMHDIAWTCVDVTDHWTVIGTDAGFVYVYDRPRETVVHRLTSQVTTIFAFFVTRVQKNPFFLKAQPSGFFGFYCVFFG